MNGCNSAAPNSIEIKSYAKINLSLDVLGKRPDGYHEVDMVMQLVDLSDSIRVSVAESGKDNDIDKDSGKDKNRDNEPEIELHITRKDLPTDRGNIAYKAAELMHETFREKSHLPGKIAIEIEKNIPVAAGLAGGSGNGAAVIHALNILWNLKLPLKELKALGAKLGADVPFCISGMASKEANPQLFTYLQNDEKDISTCVRATGTGTELEVLPPLNADIVLSTPPVSVSTAEVYRGIDSITITKKPQTDALIDALKAGSLKEVAKNVDNVLEFFTLKRYDCVMYTKNIASEKTDAEAVLMSGSGPTVFSLYADEGKAKKAFEVMRKENEQTYLCHTLCQR